jgi:hypothetical protein
VDPKLIAPLVTGVFVAWILYRRLGRLFGRQAVNVRRLKVRVGILCGVGALFLVSIGHDVTLVGALVAGVAAGAILGYFGLRHTQFEATPEGRFYTPHTYFGLLVTVLVLGRVLYRLLNLYANGGGVAPNPDPLAEYHRSPLTLTLFGLLIGYYVYFNVGVLRLSSQLAVAEPDKPL